MAKVTVINCNGQIRQKYRPTMNIHLAQTKCEFTKIFSVVNCKTNEVLVKNPSEIKNG